MEEGQKRPNAALINREWYESARKVLSYEEQGILLIEAVEYVLYGIGRTSPKGKVGIVFEMIKPALDSDVSRYAERCARNAANARKGIIPVAPSGTQSQPVAANTTTTSTSITTPTSTSTPSLSNEMSEERERWLLYGYLWSSGSKAIKQELDAFWSYYESLGWKNNKGAAIVSKLACARMWKRQFENGTPPNGADAWFKVMQACPVPDVGVWMFFAGAERVDEKAVVRLRCKEGFLADLRRIMPNFDHQLQALWRVPEVCIELLA